MQKRFVTLFLVVLVMLLGTSSLLAKEKKNVLYLNSYHHGYQWSDKLLEGIRSVLDSSEYKVDLQIEYMDAKKYNYGYINSRLFTLYHEKFKGEKFDVILISDNDALNFALNYRSVLFPGVPIIFCGINDIDSVDLSEGNITGVVESFNLVATVETAIKLHPDKRRMIVVGDQSTAGKAIQRQIDKMIAGYYRDDFLVEYWYQLTLEETLERVEQVPDDTFFFFIPWYQTVKGKFYTTEEIMGAIYSHSKIPIYTAWEFLLGHGAVGGYMLSGFKHGRDAALMVLNILRGQHIDSIPIIREADGQYMFDYSVMRRLGIEEESLPAPSVIINSPRAFYELSKELFWTIMISIILLVTALMFLGINMIARRRVERKVLDQLTFQETLMDSIPQLVSWKDSSGKYLGANRAFLEFFKISDLQNMVGRTTRDVVDDPDYVHWSISADAAVVSNREAFRKVRRKIQSFDDEIGWIEVNKVPLRDQTGKIVGILSTAENVTKEQSLEKQLLQSQKMEAIGTLAGGIAHDFNNILTSIINSTELAIDDVDENSRTASDLKRVLKAAHRGGRVVKQILSFSRPSPEMYKQVDVRKVIQEVLMLIDVSLPSSITVKTAFDDRGYYINADPTQIHQVILNLCTNAFQALRESGGELEIKLEDSVLDTDKAAVLQIDAGRYILIRVKDNGAGIPLDVVDKIFDPFFTTKDISEGTGLGLAVVHGIVTGHKGAVRVVTTEGKGTEFTIFLPATERVPLTQAPIPALQRSGKLTILFVEDDEDQLNSTPRILEEMGHRVTAMQNPTEALEEVKKNPAKYDVVISDYDMPEISGADLAESIAPLPVIIVSGREEAFVTVSSLANVVQVLAKPYGRSELEKIIGKIN